MPFRRPVTPAGQGAGRSDWVTLLEFSAAPGNLREVVDILEKYPVLANRITALIRSAKVSRPIRLRRQPEGDRLDLDACIAAAVSQRQGDAPDAVEQYFLFQVQHQSEGRKLADLHLNYESAEQYPLDVVPLHGADPGDRQTWKVDKMRWRSKTDRSAILYNGKLTIMGIPAKAHDYMLGSRSALEWIIERYQVKTDKASGIVNDPNDWCDEHDDPTYIVDLIKKVTTVSVETVKLVEQLSQ